MAKAPTPGLEDKLDGIVDPADEGPVLAVRVGAESHRVVLRRLTATHVRRMREVTGYTMGRLNAAVMAPGTQLDVDAIAVVVWLASVQAGDERPYAAVCDSITVGDLLDAMADDEGDTVAVEEPGDPEG